MAEIKAVAKNISQNEHEPYRTVVAIKVLQHFYVTETSFNSDFMKTEGRELTKEEQSLKTASIKCLRDYLCGEVNLGDCGYSSTKSKKTKKDSIEKIENIPNNLVTEESN